MCCILGLFLALVLAKTVQSRVNISNLEEALIRSFQPVSDTTSAISNGEYTDSRLKTAFRKQRVAVLISGSGKLTFH